MIKLLLCSLLVFPCIQGVGLGKGYSRFGSKFPAFLTISLNVSYDEYGPKDRKFRTIWNKSLFLTKNCFFKQLAHYLCVSARAGAKKLVDIDHRQVSIQPPIVKFPGCFVVEIKNIRIYDSVEVLGSSIFAKAEYQWLNVKEFANLKCQNASSNGCGGFGNNWYSSFPADFVIALVDLNISLLG